MRASLARLVCAAPLFAAAGAAVANDSPAETYHQYCSVCHGDKGDGRSRARQGLMPPPRDFTIPGLADALTKPRMVDVVLNGKPGTAMVGWKTRLDRPQAEALVDYIRANFMRTAPTAAVSAPPAAAQKSAAYVPSPKGHATAGKPLYDNNCATCHGPRGQGDGPRAYFIFPKPRNFLAEEARAYTPATLFISVKHGVQGREMPAWGTVFTDQQIADVSQYVYDAFVVTAARDGR